MRLLTPLLTAFLLLIFPCHRGLAGKIDVRLVDGASGETLLQQRLADGGRFALRYRHSVEKSPVEEIYEVAQDGTLFLVETTVAASGYGLPECAPGQDCVTRNGRVTFRGLRQRIDQLVLRVSYLNDMWLIFGNADVNLRQMAPGGRRILVQTQAVE